MLDSICSGVIFSNGMGPAEPCAPALTISSNPPRCSEACATASWQLPALLASHWMKIDSGEISCSRLMVSRPRSGDLPVIATVAPCAQSLAAMEYPIPADPPEMKALIPAIDVPVMIVPVVMRFAKRTLLLVARRQGARSANTQLLTRAYQSSRLTQQRE